MSVVKHGQPIRLHLDDRIERFCERLGCLMWQAVNQIDVERLEPGFPQPADGLFGFGLWLNPVDGQLHGCIEVLHAEGGPVEPGLPQGRHVIASQSARVDFNACLDLLVEWKMRADDPAQCADFLRQQKRRRAATEMKLHHFAFAPNERGHDGQLALKIFEVLPACALVGGDDRGAAAIPAKRATEREVKIERKVFRRFSVLPNPLHDFLTPYFGKMRRRGIGGIARRRYIVLPDEIEVDLQRVHAKLRTVSASASMHSSFASGGTP